MSLSFPTARPRRGEGRHQSILIELLIKVGLIVSCSSSPLIQQIVTVIPPVRNPIQRIPVLLIHLASVETIRDLPSQRNLVIPTQLVFPAIRESTFPDDILRMCLRACAADLHNRTISCLSAQPAHLAIPDHVIRLQSEAPAASCDGSWLGDMDHASPMRTVC